MAKNAASKRKGLAFLLNGRGLPEALVRRKLLLFRGSGRDRQGRRKKVGVRRLRRGSCGSPASDQETGNTSAPRKADQRKNSLRGTTPFLGQVLKPPSGGNNSRTGTKKRKESKAKDPGGGVGGNLEEEAGDSFAEGGD